MAKVVPAEGAILQYIVATMPLVALRGLSREAFAKYDTAQAKTAWGARFALMQGDQVRASAERYDLHSFPTRRSSDLDRKSVV